MTNLSNDILGTQPEPPAQPEPLTNPYAQIIAQKDEQISVLLQQTQALNEQIISMVNNGAQFSAKPAQSAQSAQSAQHTASLADDDDYSLSALANEIGKRRAH